MGRKAGIGRGGERTEGGFSFAFGLNRSSVVRGGKFGGVSDKIGLRSELMLW